jgi:hypothetical protein
LSLLRVRVILVVLGYSKMIAVLVELQSPFNFFMIVRSTMAREDSRGTCHGIDSRRSKRSFTMHFMVIVLMSMTRCINLLNWKKPTTKSEA